MAISCSTMLSNPAAFFGAMLAIKPHIITMFALGESYAGHFVCKWGGAAPPPTPPLFKGHGCLQKKTRVVVAAIDACTNKQASGRRGVDHSCLHKGKATRVICLQMGGGCPTPPLFQGHGRLLKKQNKGQVVASIDACKKQAQASGRRRVGHSCFALGESYAGHFVCKWGGLRPLQPPRFLKAVDA